MKTLIVFAGSLMMESDHEFEMEPIAMSDQDYRELTCVGHEAELVRIMDQKVMRCKHCHKLLATAPIVL